MGPLARRFPLYVPPLTNLLLLQHHSRAAANRRTVALEPTAYRIRRRKEEVMQTQQSILHRGEALWPQGSQRPNADGTMTRVAPEEVRYGALTAGLGRFSGDALTA